MSTAPHITAILLARDEGPRIGVSLHSVLDAVASATAAGLAVETLVVLASPTPATREALSEAEDHRTRVLEVDAADPGVVRNRAVEAASGEHVALLDGGALWSANWLVAAHPLVAGDPRVIAHPEVHWFFENGRELYFPPDQDDPAFDPGVLRFGACWDAQTLTATSTCREVPFPEVGERAGHGEVDHAWAKATVAAGFRHKVVPATLSYRRRRPATLR